MKRKPQYLSADDLNIALRLDIARMAIAAMERQALTPQTIAERGEVSVRRVLNVLRATGDPDMRTVGAVCFALGLQVKLGVY